MSDLEALGLLEKPHTSAGRVPTEHGFRYYVDALIQVRPPSRPDRELIERSLPTGATADELLRETTRLLSSLSHNAAVVTTPALTQVRWRRVEFVRLREERLLAVLVSDSGLVRNRLLTLDFPVSNAELAHAEEVLDAMLAESSLEQLQIRLRAEVERARAEVDQLGAKTAALGEKLLSADGEGGQVLIEGQESFFDAKEFADLKRMKELFAALEEKSRLLSVLDRTLSGSEVQIFLGADTEFSARTGAAVVAAPYATAGGVVGSLGIIGPTRMDYSRAIALVDYTARLVSRLLNPT
jgi:heat-inducible transcriptional repressor